MTDVQGQKANKAGKHLEKQVENYLNDLGYVPIMFKKVGTPSGKKIMQQEVPGFLLKNVPYTNMYGGSGRGEFVLLSGHQAPTRIECRYQNVSGSVDEKLPFLLGNCLAFEEKNVILVIEGDGMRKAARDFIKSAAKAVAYKDIKVFDLKQFKTWANKNLKSPIDLPDDLEGKMKDISRVL